jgi:hypothetical protein
MKIAAKDYDRLTMAQMLEIDRRFYQIKAVVSYEDETWHIEGNASPEDRRKIFGVLNKECGPGKKFDRDKIPMHLVPLDAVGEIAKVLDHGAKKYGTNNWQHLSDGQNRYLGALLRHLMAYQKGELKDLESGLSHLAHAGCNLLFLLWLELNG